MFEEKSNYEKYYGGIDGLRAIACVGIVMMHMASKDNNNYALPEDISRIIGSFTDFVFLFMMISAFGLCCGYYRKVLSGKLNFAEFYRKRYAKILPFFSLIVLLGVAAEFSRSAVIEGIADISLTFGLFPNNITVIGVGWFLGLIFAFYMIFPFFCVLIEHKRRAWIIFAITLVLNYICGSYFSVGRSNIVYSSCFFILGGIIYLYREELGTLKLYVIIPILMVSIIVYYLIGTVYAQLMVSAILLVFSITDTGERILHNKATVFVGNISLEIYLCHMVIFRGFEKLGLNTVLGYGMLQYVFIVSLVFLSSVIFILVVKEAEKKVKWLIKQRKS